VTRDQRTVALAALGIIGGGFVFQFYQGGVPASSPGAPWQNAPVYRFWLAVWATFYRLDPKLVQAIAYQEQGRGGPGSSAAQDGWNIAETNGTTSYGPLHVNDVNLAAAGWAQGPAGSDTMRGMKLGCQWLRHELDAAGSDEGALRLWNGSAGYVDSVTSYRASYV